MRKVIAVAALALLAACGGSESDTDLEGPAQDEALTPSAAATDSVPSLSAPPVAGAAPIVDSAGPPMMMDTAPRPVYGAPIQAPGADTVRP